jgi:eukaryotic-like serine/threonine-protein kinase
VQNSFAWALATCPDPALRNPARAVALARSAVEQAPSEGIYWRTLGVARYRAGEWKTAAEALEKSILLRAGGDVLDWLFLGMSQWHLGDRDQARKWYLKAIEGMDQNPTKNDELHRFRAEAAELIDSARPAGDVEDRPAPEPAPDRLHGAGRHGQQERDQRPIAADLTGRTVAG